MRYFKLIIIAAFLSSIFTGCSYVSDMAEGAITKRSSFSVNATYSGGNVILTWDKTDTSNTFAGIEVYRTSQKDDEYSSYELVASRYSTSLLNSGDLSSGLTTSCNVDAPTSSGVYFYRIGIIHIDTDDNDIPYNASNQSQYNQYTNIDAISGYGQIVIP